MRGDKGQPVGQKRQVIFKRILVLHPENSYARVLVSNSEPVIKYYIKN